MAHRFSGDMLIKDAIALHPGAAAVFERHGLSCATCMAAAMESVEAAAAVHDIPVESLLSDLDALASGVLNGMET